MIRPEAKEALIRYREALVGGVIVLLGLSWLFRTGGLLGLIAPVVILAGAALIWMGLQRARFRSGRDGLGSVQVDEGQVTYFGPLSGGAVALREMSRLTLDGTGTPAHWQLEQPGTQPLMIPVDAHGADALFDAFASLPGLRTEKMLAEMRARPTDSVVIWEKTPRQVSGQRVH